MQKLKQSFLTIVIGLALAAGLSYAWTGPTANPPNNNAPSPINVSSSSQIKAGALQVNGFRNIGNSMFDGLATFNSSIKIPTGAGAGKVLTSDASGNASWGNAGGGIGGSGTANYVSKWTNSTTLGNSQIFDNGTNVGIGTANPQAKLDIVGSVKIADGTQGAGKVLTSDASGNASWAPNEGGGIWIGHKFVQNGATASCDIDNGFNRGGFLTNFNAKMEDSKMYLRMIRKAFSNKYNQNDFDTGWVNSARIYSSSGDELKAEFGLILATDLWGNTCIGNW